MMGDERWTLKERQRSNENKTFCIPFGICFYTVSVCTKLYFYRGKVFHRHKIIRKNLNMTTEVWEQPLLACFNEARSRAAILPHLIIF
uniref:Uncharacterized protein n=1 Tax=Pyxicephalus adspersus TaxID=30357 RepID=A0AAV3AMY0_PYXAD|nr:TPA: hypothetical protein GDO54_010632 [Pyxicephalus adspersus]